MTDKEKVRVSKNRELYTYAEIWRTSYWTMDQAEKELEGSYFQIMASLVFTSFTFEAYLNHIGSRMFRCWDDLEQLSPQGKMNVIAEKLNIRIDKGKRPFQTVTRLLKFRNDVAHGKSFMLTSDKEVSISGFDNIRNMHEPLESEWERYCTMDNAKRAREDVQTIIEQFHKASGVTEELFFTGLTTTEAKFLSK